MFGLYHQGEDIYQQDILILSPNKLQSLGHLHLKVLSASITGFRISLAILPDFVWISCKNFYFSFFDVSHKSLSFISWNLIEYLHTYFQTSREHWHIWTSGQIFYCFALCMGVNNTQKYWNGIKEEETCFHALLTPAL